MISGTIKGLTGWIILYSFGMSIDRLALCVQIFVCIDTLKNVWNIYIYSKHIM